MGKLHAMGDLVGLARTQPKTVKSAPCQQVVIEGQDASLDILPAIKCWPMDAGRFITLPLVITRDPATGRRNAGIYRMQIYDAQTAGMHWQTHKVGAHHYREGEARGQQRLEVAVALGGDPTTVWTGALPLPPDMDEIAVSGLIREDAVEMVRCKTVDLEVPAQAEFVLEGYVVPGELRKEGPFGDHTGYYSMADDYPVFHLTAVTHRREPIYPAVVVGRPPTEDFFMGAAGVKILLPALQMTLPEIADINMPAEGIFHNLTIVSMKKEYPGHVRKVGLCAVGPRASDAHEDDRHRRRLRGRTRPLRGGVARDGKPRSGGGGHLLRRGSGGRSGPLQRRRQGTAAKSASTPLPRGRWMAAPGSGPQTS